jgi:hypothetical protein
MTLNDLTHVPFMCPPSATQQQIIAVIAADIGLAASFAIIAWAFYCAGSTIPKSSGLHTIRLAMLVAGLAAGTAATVFAAHSASAFWPSPALYSLTLCASACVAFLAALALRRNAANIRSALEGDSPRWKTWT